MIKVKRSKISVFVLSYISFFIGYLLASHKYVFSGFLTQDDNIFISKAIFGLGERPVNSSILFFLIELFAKAQSIITLRVLFLGIFSLSVSFLAIILTRYIKGVLLPVTLAMALGTVPIAADQIVFVSASHPSLALFFSLFGLLVFDRLRGVSYVTFTVANVVLVVILFAAAFSSPVAFLVPLALPLWLVISRYLLGSSTCTTGEWLFTLFVVILVCGFIYLVTGVGDYHYSRFVGWTEVSLEQVFRNLMESVEYLAGVYGETTGFTLWIFLSCVLTIASLLVYVHIKHKNCSIKVEQRSNDSVVLGLNALILSALTFGPGSVTVNLLDRYLVVPIFFGLLSAISFILYVIPTSKYFPVWVRLLLIGSLAIIVGLNITTLSYMIDEEYDSQLRTHQAVSKLVEKEESDWTTNAQVVLLTIKGYKTPTFGYNHWSTWYFRYLTKKPYIIGLLGANPSIRSPFVDGFREHGSEYWSVANGRSTRLKMIGLEAKRPLFVYQQNKAGEFEPIDYVLFSGGQRLRSVPRGRSYSESSFVEFKKVCSESPLPKFFVWAGTKHEKFSISRMDNVINVLGAKTKFDGSNSVQLIFNLPDKEYFRLSMRVVSGAEISSIKYDETSPPMPLLTPHFAIYQRPQRDMYFADRQFPFNALLRAKHKSIVDISYEGVSGCVIVVGSGEKVFGSVRDRSINGKWSFGRGFKSRYWKGEIKNVILETKNKLEKNAITSVAE